MKTIYLALSNFEVNSQIDYYAYIKTHIISEEIFNNLEESIELYFENNILFRVIKTFNGEKEEKALTDIEKSLELIDFELNKIYGLQFKENGYHQLGGEFPSNFLNPPNKLQVPMQYIGLISNEDPIFKWMPSDLHIVFPKFLTFERLYLDYSEPLKPKIINEIDLEKAHSAFSDLNEKTEIVYNKVNFNFKEITKFDTTFGSSGIPKWISWPEIPKCPKTGKYMRFVCQLHEGTYVKRHNINLSEERYRHYFHKLDFWSGGNLFIFFAPKSRIACLFIAS